MTVRLAALIQSQVLTNALVAYYTSNGRVRIDAMTCYNDPSHAAELVTIEWVPSGGSTGVASIITSHNMLPGETWTVWGLIGHTLMVGDKIYAKGAAGSLVSLFASGTETS